jgi:anti-sigma factor RsiW
VHPSDATLLALIHGELAAGPKAEVQAHLTHCAGCASTVGELRAGDAQVGRLLGTLDHPVPRLDPPVPAAGTPRLRRPVLAASVALLMAGAVAAAVPGTPLHRWIHGRHDVPGQIETRPGAPAPARPAPAGDQAAGGVEVPVSRGLIIAFGQPEPDGILTITVADRPDVSLRAFGGAVAYRVGEGRIAVDNRRPAGRYALEVPGSLRRLTVLLGGRVIFNSDGGPLGTAGRDTISLSMERAR